MIPPIPEITPSANKLVKAPSGNVFLTQSAREAKPSSIKSVGYAAQL